MSDEVGRNDPCPCGSGKKYKYCCLRKEEEKRAKERSREQKSRQEESSEANSDENSADVDPKKENREELDRLFTKFERMDLEERFEFFHENYQDADKIAGDYATEMLLLLFPESARQGKLSRYLSLDKKIRSDRPDIQEEGGAWFLRWRILALLWTGEKLNREDLNKLSQQYVNDLDALHPAFMAFLFHGSLDQLKTLFRLAAPQLKTATGVIPGATEKLLDKGIEMEIYSELAKEEGPRSGRKLFNSLQKRLRRYHEDLAEEVLIEWIEVLSGKKSFDWKLEDFDWEGSRTISQDSLSPDLDFALSSGNEEKEEAQETNYSLLGDEFHRFLHSEKGISWPRARLARNGLINYLIRRAKGEIGPKPSLEETLIPDTNSFNLYLDEYLSTFTPKVYQAVTPYLYLKPWFEFLQEKSLIDQKDSKEALRALESLGSNLLEYCETDRPDPQVIELLNRWPQTA